MAKKKQKSKGTKKAPPLEQEEKDRLTLEALDAMSSDDDEGAASDDGNDQEEWNAEALALRQAIADGAFDHLIQKARKEQQEAADSDDEMEEVGGSDDNDENAHVQDEEQDESDESKQESDSESDDNEEFKATMPAASSGKALVAVTEELVAVKRRMPWAETFDVIPSKPLPFGAAGAEGNPLDVHDDLKREVAFYNLALDSVNEARNKCKEAGISFSRPEDFFAEMVKTDDHMAKVKDRLIFETKKMDAVAQRKANKEQKLRSKEARANKLAEKAKRKKQHLRAVDEWAKSAAANRGGGALREEDDNVYLARLDKKKGGWTDREGNVQTGPNKKRMAADRKYGYGGKRGRFKQNDPKSINDMSSFNPRGNFAGGTKSKGGSGAKRKGKRARDAARARR